MTEDEFMKAMGISGKAKRRKADRADQDAWAGLTLALVRTFVMQPVPGDGEQATQQKILEMLRVAQEEHGLDLFSWPKDAQVTLVMALKGIEHLSGESAGIIGMNLLLGNRGL